MCRENKELLLNVSFSLFWLPLIIFKFFPSTLSFVVLIMLGFISFLCIFLFFIREMTIDKNKRLYKENWKNFVAVAPIGVALILFCLEVFKNV
jgi:hypothetical protein